MRAQGRVGFVMLCHTALRRAGQVVRFWAEAGAPVVIHVDQQAGAEAVARLRANLADLPNVRFCRRYRCEWGTWGLVQATQEAAAQLLAEFPEVGHVYTVSGACLPLRPLADLEAFLADHRHTDFIESVTIADVGWTVGGLSHERFTLRFPFAYQRRRWLFDAWVNAQRKLKLRRRPPAGVTPHLGSQWWCLTRATLEAILTDPDRKTMDHYFRRVWIPDESYFQTLVRRHSTAIESRSLTLSKFDFQGKPHVLYDDHLQLLRRSDCFVARKAWPDANRLYQHFLSPDLAKRPRAVPNPGKIDRHFSQVTERRVRGRAGLYMHSRFPREHRENGKTAAPYSVFCGFAELYSGYEDWLAGVLGGRVHGHLFHPDRVQFAGRESVFNGCLSDSASLRDHDPRAFLASLIWSTRGERQCFQHGPRDNQALNWFMATDPNAQIAVITGGWALPLARDRRPFAEVRAEAARLQQAEVAFLDILRSPWVRARIRVWTLADAIAAPIEPIEAVLDDLGRPDAAALDGVPPLVPLAGFGGFLQSLRNAGMSPHLVGDYTGDPEPRAQPARPAQTAR